MAPRRLLNLGLVALVSGLAVYLFGPLRTAPDATPLAPLSELDPLAVHDIELLRRGQPALRLEHDVQTWYLRAPFAVPADDFKVNALLSMLRAPARRIRGDGGGNREFGLQPPRAVARFDGTRIQIGGTEPVSGKRYMALDGQVLLVEDSWFTHLFATPERFADPRPLNGDPGIKAIVFDHAGWRLRGNRWHRSPAQPGDDGGTGVRLAEAWTQARALAVSAVDEGLPWGGQVEVETEGAPGTRVFRLAQRERMVFLALRDPPLQYQFSERQAARLLPPDAVGAPVR